MAKTIMVSDKTYNKLTKLKKSANYSYSELLESLINKPEDNNKESILALKGNWVERKEDEEIEKELKKTWEKWTKRYA